MASYDIGFLGGGQLARMSIQAAQRMGLDCVALDAGDHPPASGVTHTERVSLTDAGGMANVIANCQRVTFESEFVPVPVVRRALEIAGMAEHRVLPGLDCLTIVQDKKSQREAYARHGAPTPRLLDPHNNPPLPVVFKTRFGGYDGKGTYTARTPEEFRRHVLDLEGEAYLVEEFVPFVRELAVMVCRWLGGSVCFPTMETRQVNHVCDLVFPAGVDASAVAIQAVEAVGGFGLFGVELFELADGSFQINEIAPRPHNTGHYTLDWGGISQFEAHVRLVMGWPVPKPVGQPAAMANLLGHPGNPDAPVGLRDRLLRATEAALRAVPDCHIHWYGKREARPGRKMGHINTVGPDALERVTKAREAFYLAW